MFSFGSFKCVVIMALLVPFLCQLVYLIFQICIFFKLLLFINGVYFEIDYIFVLFFKFSFYFFDTF